MDIGDEMCKECEPLVPPRCRTLPRLEAATKFVSPSYTEQYQEIRTQCSHQMEVVDNTITIPDRVLSTAHVV